MPAIDINENILCTTTPLTQLRSCKRSQYTVCGMPCAHYIPSLCCYVSTSRYLSLAMCSYTCSAIAGALLTDIYWPMLLVYHAWCKHARA